MQAVFRLARFNANRLLAVMQYNMTCLPCVRSGILSTKPGYCNYNKPMYLMNSTDIRKYQSLSLVPYRDCSKNPLHSPDRSIPLRCLVFLTVIHFHLGHYCTLYYQDVIFMTFVTYISTYQDTSKVNVVAIPWCVSIINEDNTICYPIQWDWIKY